MEAVEPVWITGVGAATPLGHDVADIEANLLAGRSGVVLVTRFPTDDYPSRIAALLPQCLRPRGRAVPCVLDESAAGPACVLLRRIGAH